MPFRKELKIQVELTLVHGVSPHVVMADNKHMPVFSVFFR